MVFMELWCKQKKTKENPLNYYEFSCERLNNEHIYVLLVECYLFN